MAYILTGVGCAGGAGCKCRNCGGVGDVTNIGSDISALLSDVFTNADGSLNWTAVGFAAIAVGLIAANWGHTTTRRRK
jgi:hypothetical protein